ncbi:hypothetical protein BKA70DRAFT_512391 [Coprinopsis sp. MPI-PUGE-AT-0042]|nr:hypothetical protein BKA70DRAFT_512391 [Coprinopsis sp. MPI-PUGE-AT-0042]
MKRDTALNLLASLLWPFSSIARIWKREKYLAERIASLPKADQALLHVDPASVSRCLAMLMGCTNHGRFGWVDSRTVRKIHFYKNHLRWSEYEYLVLECKFDLCEETFHLLVERFHGSNIKPLETSMESTATTSPTPAAGSKHPVKDRVRRITSLEVLNHLTPIAVYEQPAVIALLEVCCLLDLLHTKSESSALHRSQCIWLADTVWAVLGKRHGSTFDLLPSHSAPSDAEKCCQMPIATLETEEIEQLSSELNIQFESSIETVNRIWPPPSKH